MMSATSSGSTASARARAVVDAHLAGAGEEVGERRGALGGVALQHDDLLERVGHGPRLAQHRHVVGVEEPVDRAQEARAAPAEDERRLRSLEAGVQRHQHAAGAQRAERGDHPLADVGCPHADPIAGLEPRGDERAGGFLDASRELGERQPQVAVDQTVEVGEARRARPHEPRNRPEIRGRRGSPAGPEHGVGDPAAVEGGVAPGPLQRPRLLHPELQVGFPRVPDRAVHLHRAAARPVRGVARERLRHRDVAAARRLAFGDRPRRPGTPPAWRTRPSAARRPGGASPPGSRRSAGRTARVGGRTRPPRRSCAR